MEVHRLKIHGWITQYVCDHCGYKAKTEAALRSHVWYWHEFLQEIDT